MNTSQTGTPAVHIELGRGIPEYAEGYARAKILDVLRFAPRPVLHVRIHLDLIGNRRHPDVTAHANIDVNGTPVISQSVGATAGEAVDLLQGKLRGQFSRL